MEINKMLVLLISVPILVYIAKALSKAIGDVNWVLWSSSGSEFTSATGLNKHLENGNKLYYYGQELILDVRDGYFEKLGGQVVWVERRTLREKASYTLCKLTSRKIH